MSFMHKTKCVQRNVILYKKACLTYLNQILVTYNSSQLENGANFSRPSIGNFYMKNIIPNSKITIY